MVARLEIKSGDQFGRLTVVREGEPETPGRRRIVCRCACGVEVTAGLIALTTGNTKSCGCLSRDAAAARMKTHGATIGGKPPEYNCWVAIRVRCNNPKNGSYAYYGGRGIKVCARWQSFEAFLEDMGPRPSPAHSIDRKDNDGNYEPGNCRWATKAEQMQNTREIYRHNKTGHNGIFLLKSGKYVATVGKGRARVQVGEFFNLQDAVLAQSQLAGGGIVGGVRR